MPTKIELSHLANGPEAVRSYNMRAFSGVQTGEYWSSSTCEDDSSEAYDVNISYETVVETCNPKIHQDYVWPVRNSK